MFRYIIKRKHTVRKLVFISLGTISLALGIIGIFVPLLPTTPFLLLTAYLYSKGSKRLYYWLLNNKYFGEYIKRYKEGKGITLKTKIISIATLWITILTSIFFFVESIVISIILGIIAIGVTYHLASKPTYSEK